MFFPDNIPLLKRAGNDNRTPALSISMLSTKKGAATFF